MTEKNTEINCTKCEKYEIIENEVDERSMYECKNCKHIWYSTRETTNGPQVIIDEITDNVSEKGEYEIDGSVLFNVVFRSDNSKVKSSTVQLDDWAKINKLHYGFVGNKIRFWR